MDYCGPHGIPHSEFLSWPVDDQAKALWWASEQAARCSQCGTADWEWAEVVNGDAFTAEPYVCRGCAGLENVRAKPESKIPGMHVRLVRNGGSSGN